MISKNTPKKLSRRKWLRDAAMAATGAAVLPSFLTGCTEKHLDELIPKFPDGGLGSTPDTWYRLKVTYKDRNNVTKEGYMGASGLSAGETDWDNMVIGGYQSKFKLHPSEESGFYYWEIDDGNWLSMRSTGWAYRSYFKQRIGWKIFDGKLYNSYWNLEKWQDYPMGAQWGEGLFTSQGYYVGVDLGADRVLTNCVLEPVQ